MRAFVHTHSTRSDGTKDCFLTQRVAVRVELLDWQKNNLTFTASGYGSRIPTQYKVKFNGRWRRVYCRIYSNSGTLYLGKLSDNLRVCIETE